MSLQSKEIIESQKSYYQEAVKKREELLKKQGLENKVIFKDSILKSLKAKVRQMNQRCLSICESENRSKMSKSSEKEKAEI